MMQIFAAQCYKGNNDADCHDLISLQLVLWMGAIY